MRALWKFGFPKHRTGPTSGFLNLSSVFATPCVMAFFHATAVHGTTNSLRDSGTKAVLLSEPMPPCPWCSVFMNTLNSQQILSATLIKARVRHKPATSSAVPSGAGCTLQRLPADSHNSRNPTHSLRSSPKATNPNPPKQLNFATLILRTF